MRLALVPFGVLLAASTSRADTLVTFDDLPIGTAVNTQYLSLAVNGQTVSGGVFFNGVTGFPGGGPHISNDATPHSGGAVLINTPFANELGEGPVTFQFTIPQKTVQLYGGYVFTKGALTRQATLMGFAFDSSGNQIPTPVAIDGPKTITGGQAATLFSISSATANISRVVFDAGISDAVIDDLQFGGGGSGDGLPTPPIVVLQNPVPALGDYVHSPLLVNGTVSGQGLLPTVSAVVTPLDHPPHPGFFESIGVMPIVTTLPETFSNTSTGAIGVPYTTLPIGNYQVIVTATNYIGQSGSAGAQFLNFPPLLFQETPDVAAQLGGFRFAQPTGACQMVVFDGGASAYFPGVGGAADHRILVPDAIMTKWLDIETNLDEQTRLLNAQIIGGDGTLGCPLGDAQTLSVGDGQTPLIGDGTTLVQVQVQDFERGRIYATDGWAVYTPTALANPIAAISMLADPGAPDALTSFNERWVNEVGVPINDPEYDLSGEEPTHLFQQFKRLGIATPLTSDGVHRTPLPPFNTVEIRGRLPNAKLYIERVGGSLIDFQAATGRNPDSSTATVWESFDCPFEEQTGQFDCQVSRPHVRAVTSKGVPLYTNGSEIADYQQFCNVADVSFIKDCSANITFDQTEWCAVSGKTGADLSQLSQEPTSADSTDVLTMGWVRSSNRAGADWASSHAHMHFSKAGGVLNFISTLAEDACPLGLCGIYAYPPLALIHEVTSDVSGSHGWADWGMIVRPLALSEVDPNAALVRLPAAGSDPPAPPFWNLLASNGDPREEGEHCTTDTLGGIETEWEADWWPYSDLDGLHAPGTDGNHWFPVSGDLVLLNGRWIMDCAHLPDHSEIHPPNTIVRIDSTLFQLDGALPNSADPPQLVTRAQIWMNDFYEGGGFQTTVWPPPRPSPSAQISTSFVSFNPTVINWDSSVSSSFINGPVAPFGFVWPDASTATVRSAPDGAAFTVSGPPSTHEVKESGQAIRPADNSDHATGAAGNFVGLLYVGWNK